ncbi:MAG TPA: protein translocase subunit SecD [Acetobacteraceae bacterium]|nr:protein translocase subunit SecD [Acetobacteraceae bacterium]
MLYFTRLKTTLIALVCLLGILFILPNLIKRPAAWLPWQQVHLGLDLRGGSYLLMQVDMNAVVREELNGLVDEARSAMLKANLDYTDLGADLAKDRVTLTLLKPSEAAAARRALSGLIQPVEAAGGAPDLDLAISGTGHVTLTLTRPTLIAKASQAVAQSITIIQRRIDGTGVVDPQIARQGTDQIVIQLPGISDPSRIKRLLGTTAHMTFHLVAGNVNPETATPPPGVEILPMQDDPAQKIAVRSRVEVDGADLTSAQAGQDPQSGQWIVNFAFNAQGARRFARVTTQNVGKPFAIVLDRKVISAPVIREPIIGGQGQISGNFTARGATDLALLLRAGALPAPLTVVEQQSVGPELGADAIRAGVISLAVGFGLVIVFMAMFYGLFGWFANLALVMNLVLMLAILSIMGATLTLPGMAGILLTLGMAVDANVLINERVREEVKLGRKPLAALEAGYKRAYGTIIDSNVTTLLAHITLFIFGSPPVRGFAVTICVGILTTLFTATVLVRLLTARWYVARRPAALPVT